MFLRRLPVDWTGYDSLDALVLYDPDWTQMTVHQQRAIGQWVTNGGRVLVVLGTNVLPPGNALAGLLPLRIGEPRQTPLSLSTLRRWRLTDYAKREVARWPVEIVEPAPGWKIEFDDDAQLRAHGPAGFGRMGVLACDPSVLGGRQGANLAPFWIEQFAGLLDRRTLHLGRAKEPEYRGYYGNENLSPGQQATNAVLEHFHNIEELRPIHIGWVVGVLVTLAVLIGPVDYLVLRKLGRLPWTWVTASACIGLFSVGAYYGVEYIRGGVLQARVVSVIDGVQGRPGGWATRYAGIFAPRSDDYRLAGTDRSQWWSGLSPTLGDRFSSFRETIGSRQIYCRQHVDGGNLPYSVPINIWAMQCLLDESPVEKLPFAATARRGRDAGDWIVTVENLTDRPISGGCLLTGPTDGVVLGPVPPREQREFRGRPVPQRAWETSVARVVSGSDNAGRQASLEVTRTALLAQGTARRSEAIGRYLRERAAVVCVEFDRAAVPFSIADKRCEFDHRQVARLVVFPEARK